MTREQAKSGLDSVLASMDKGLDPEHRRQLLENGFQMLGLLKLDEPAPNCTCRFGNGGLGHEIGCKIERYFADAAFRANAPKMKFEASLLSEFGSEVTGKIISRLDAAGLKIVEKDKP